MWRADLKRRICRSRRRGGWCDFGAVVQVFALPVFDMGQDLALRCRVALELVGYDHPRRILKPLQQLAKEPLSSFGIAPALHQDVEHDPVLVNGTPEILLLATNADEHLILSANSGDGLA